MDNVRSSSPPIPDEQLMLYLDGELSRDEGRELERLLADAPEAQARLSALQQLRGILRARVEVAEDDAEPRLAAMWDKLKVDLGPTAPHAAPRFWQRVRDWFETYRGHVLTGAVAAAAGALIATAVSGGPGPTPARARHQAVAADVESVEVPDGSAMVFQIPAEAAGEAPTTVIWVTEEQGEGPI